MPVLSDSITERTPGAGVTVDGLLIQDGGLPTLPGAALTADQATALAAYQTALAEAAVGQSPLVVAPGQIAFAGPSRMVMITADTVLTDAHGGALLVVDTPGRQTITLPTPAADFAVRILATKNKARVVTAEGVRYIAQGEVGSVFLSPTFAHYDGLLRPEESYLVIENSPLASANAIAWSPQLGIFAALSNWGGVAATSPDGLQWSQTAVDPRAWRSLDWSPELALFAAVADSGVGNRVMTSPDGLAWTLQTSVADVVWTKVCWGQGRFVAVASGSATGMTSTDGLTWSPITLPAANQWRGLAWSAALSLWVAVSSNGTNRVATSPDGLVWTAGAGLSGRSNYDVVWSAEHHLFVSVTNSSGIMDAIHVSADGLTWTPTQSAVVAAFSALAYAPQTGAFLAVGQQGAGDDRALVSYDGWTWHLRPVGNNLTSWRGITWSPQLGIFAAVADAGGSRFMLSEPG